MKKTLLYCVALLSSNLLIAQNPVADREQQIGAMGSSGAASNNKWFGAVSGGFDTWTTGTPPIGGTNGTLINWYIKTTNPLYIPTNSADVPSSAFPITPNTTATGNETCP